MAPVTATISSTPTAVAVRARAPAHGYDEYCATSVRIAARSLLGRYGIREQDLEDVQQDLAVNLIPRLKAFNPAKGTWTTHVKNSVGKAMATLLRHRRAQCRRPAMIIADDTAPVAGSAGHDGVTLMGTPDHLPNKRADGQAANTERHMDISAAMEELTTEQRRLCHLLAIGNTMTESAAAMKVSRWDAYAMLDEIRATFASFGLDPSSG